MSNGDRLIIEFVKVMRDLREVALRIEAIQKGILDASSKHESDTDKLVRLAEVRNDDFRRFLDDLRGIIQANDIRHDRNERILSEILNAARDYFKFGRSRAVKEDE